MGRPGAFPRKAPRARRACFYVAFALIAFWFARATEATVAADGGCEITSVKVGVNGAYKTGFLTRLVVEFTPTESSESSPLILSVESVDSDGAPFVMRKEATLDEARAGVIETVGLLTKATSDLTVRLGESETTLKPGKDFAKPQSPSRPIYFVVGNDKIGLNEAFAEMRWNEERRPSVVKVDRITDLPTDYRAYEAVDRLILTTEDAAIYEGEDSPESPRMKAIERWVERGGNVVLLAGKKSLPLLKPEGTLGFLSPGTQVADKAHEFRAWSALTRELQNVKNLVMTGSKSSPFLETPVVTELKPGARVEIQEAETPTLVSRPVGLGSIVYFAANLSEPPISNWSGRGRLTAKLLGYNPDAAIGARSGGVGMVNRGYVDVSGQARSSADVFQTARPIPFAVIATLILVYLVVVAPLDWFIAKRLFKRPMITWATFPISALIFCGVAIAISESRTPKECAMNQYDLLDVDLTSGTVRNTTWIGLYSPYGARYDIKYAPSFDAVSDASVELRPLPLSGSGLGGSEHSSYAPKLWDRAYDVSAGAISGVPLAKRSSKSFYGRWTGRLELPKAEELRDDGLTLRGVLVNPFDVPIYSAYVITDRCAYSLGTLPPGETVLDAGAIRLDPQRALNEHRSSIPTDATVYDANNYNSDSMRVPYILRAASFYDFAGGVELFGIEKRLVRDVDLSALLRCGRAVIYGTIVDPDNEVYRPSAEQVRQANDVTERERYQMKIAKQRGEVYKNARIETLEKYGLYGTSDKFASSDVTLDGLDTKRRFLVVRIVAPTTVVNSHYATDEEK